MPGENPVMMVESLRYVCREAAIMTMLVVCPDFIFYILDVINTLNGVRLSGHDTLGSYFKAVLAHNLVNIFTICRVMNPGTPGFPNSPA